MRGFFLVGSCFPVELLFFFFFELPPVKVNLVEKPAAFERLPVPGAPLYGACHAESMMYGLQKKQHLHVCRCLENGMDMGAGTILSITIIAWAYLPVNRNTVPVCVICAPIWCHLVIFLWGVFPDSPLECIKRPPRSGVFLDGLYVFSK